MATHSSTFAWRIPWMEQAAVHGVAKSWTWLSDFTFTFHFHPLEKEMATHSSILDWRISGMGEPGGLPPMGLQSQTWLTWLSSSSSRNDGGERKAGNFVFSIILHDIMPTILLCFGNYSFEQSVSHLVSESTWHVLTHKCVLSVHTHTTFSSLLLFAPSPKMCKEKQNHPGCVYTQQSQCVNGNHGMGSSLTMSPALGVLINRVRPGWLFWRTGWANAERCPPPNLALAHFLQFAHLSCMKWPDFPQQLDDLLQISFIYKKSSWRNSRIV